MHVDKLRNPWVFSLPLDISELVLCCCSRKYLFFASCQRGWLLISTEDDDFWLLIHHCSSIYVIVAEWPTCFFSVLPVGQCRSIRDKLLTQPLPKNRHSLAARGAPLPIPDQGGQADLGYSGWSVCHVRKWVLSLALCRNMFVQEHVFRQVLIVPFAAGISMNKFWCSLAFWQLLTAFCLIQDHYPYAEMSDLEVKKLLSFPFLASSVQCDHWRMRTEPSHLDLPVRLRWKNSYVACFTQPRASFPCFNAACWVTRLLVWKLDSYMLLPRLANSYRAFL